MAKRRNNTYHKKIYNQTVEVISSVVKQNLCTGCGICAAICPTGSLTMHFNDNGEYISVLGNGCESCDLCSSVCPQLAKDNENLNVQNIISNEFRDVLGCSDELTTWGGYAVDSNRRLRSASGGMLTLVLQYLLDSHKIDAAIVVGPANTDNGLLFEAKIVRTQDELDACVGSKYYPIELSKALSELKSTKERVAIVGLPCHVSAVRLLMEKSKQFKNQIHYIFGLVCGHGVSTHFTDQLITATGVSSNSIDGVEYRGKKDTKKSSEYIFSVYKNGCTIGNPISLDSSSYGAAWTRRLFVPRSCDFCPDCFAKNADATFMDAWLPEYIKNPRGTSLIVSRNAQVSEIIQGLSKSGLANILEVTPDDILRSQAGVIRHKRELLPDRVFSAESRSKAVPARLKNLGAKGTWKQHRENARYERYRCIASFVWQLNLPPRLRLRIIMLLTAPGIFKWGKLVLKKVLGARGVLFIKSIVARTKYVWVKND